MYATRPAGRTRSAPGDWGIRHAVRVMFPDPAISAANAAHTERFGVYMGDLLSAYGLGFRPGARDHRHGQSYGEMAETVIDMIVPAGEEIDLIVLAIAIPDITPGRATATYLSYICPGNPMAFAVCDQGRAAAFTGLRLIRDYAAAGECQRALLVIVEQAELPYDPGVPVEVPAEHAAVAVLFGSAPTGGAAGEVGATTTPVAHVKSVRNYADIAADEITAALGKHLEMLSDERDDLRLIVGSSLGASTPHHVAAARVADAAQPYTGVWWALAEEFAAEGLPPGRIVLADYDAQLRYLSVAAIDTVAARESSSPDVHHSVSTA